MFSQFLKDETIANMRKLLLFLRMSKVNLWYLPLSAFLALCQSLVTMYSTFLLFPLARGIINNDFSHVAHLRGMGKIVDHFPWLSQDSTRLFIFLVLWIYALSLLRNVFRYFSSLCTQIQAKLATAKVRELLIVKCLSYGKDFYDKNTISYLQSVLTKSTDLIEAQFKVFQNFTSQIFMLCVYFLIMSFISWQLTALALIFFPLITWVTASSSIKIKQLQAGHHQASANFNDKIFNLLYCMPVIKSFVKEREEIKKFSDASAQEIEQSFQMQRVGGLVKPIEDMGSMSAILLMAFGMAWVLHTGRGIDPSNAFVFFYLSMRIMPELSVFNQFKVGTARSATALHDIEHVLNQPDAAAIPSGKEVFAGLSQGICFKDLFFRYEEKGPLVLNKVNLAIKKGSVTAIVGPSGSGKTTLISLLLRFYDCPAGSVFIDQKDIREFDVASLRKHIAFVSQEVLLFNDTVRNNILYGAEGEVSEDFLNELGAKAMLHDFVDKMPNKYDTHIGERGNRLSGGERQRLSIARAIVKDPEILIMDEATSALDSGTEARINEFLAEIAKDKTLIVIAHRLSTIKRADQVIYIHQGQVAETGTLQELIDKKGRFFKMWQAQKL